VVVVDMPFLVDMLPVAWFAGYLSLPVSVLLGYGFLPG
jgi:hypothetical protein